MKLDGAIGDLWR